MKHLLHQAGAGAVVAMLTTSALAETARNEIEFQFHPPRDFTAEIDGETRTADVPFVHKVACLRQALLTVPCADALDVVEGVGS